MIPPRHDAQMRAAEERRLDPPAEPEEIDQELPPDTCRCGDRCQC